MGCSPSKDAGHGQGVVDLAPAAPLAPTRVLAKSSSLLSTVKALDVLPDSRVVTAASDRTVQIWETLEPANCIASITVDDTITAICGLENDRVVAALGGALRCWNVSDPSEWKLHKVVQSTTPITKLCTLPPGRLVTGDSEGQVKIWGWGWG